MANTDLLLVAKRLLKRGARDSGFGGREGPNSVGKIGIAGVLRLRATRALSRDKSVRRSAQDDGFVGIVTKVEQKVLSVYPGVSQATRE
jgi:hypothetical protein